MKMCFLADLVLNFDTQWTQIDDNTAYWGPTNRFAPCTVLTEAKFSFLFWNGVARHANYVAKFDFWCVCQCKLYDNLCHFYTIYRKSALAQIFVPERRFLTFLGQKTLEPSGNTVCKSHDLKWRTNGNLLLFQTLRAMTRIYLTMMTAMIFLSRQLK